MRPSKRQIFAPTGPVTSITIIGDSNYTLARAFAFECFHYWWGNAIPFHVQFGGACFEFASTESLRP